MNNDEGQGPIGTLRKYTGTRAKGETQCTNKHKNISRKKGDLNAPAISNLIETDAWITAEPEKQGWEVNEYQPEIRDSHFVCSIGFMGRAEKQGRRD